MEYDDYLAIELRLKELDKTVEVIAKGILNEIKLRAKTYGEISDELKTLGKTIFFNHQDRYAPIIKRIYELLEEEMKGLPLTSHSNQ